ncbi:TolC family protein [Leadbetterella sp. DM7]|uniref:TolC family protein n=1 Tax=Leadbetterella sp. DM7 TaxID=3235085 RepID=UPI00349EA1E9
MKSRILIAGIFLLVSALRSNGQTTLTLQEAIKYSLANSETIKKARLDIENGLNVVKETRASAKPQLSAVSSITLNPVVQQFVLPAEAFGGTPGEFIAIKAGQTWNAMTNLQLSQQLYNQQLFTGLKAARSSAEFYNLMKDLSEENVVQQVATNYYQVLVNQHKLGLIDDNLARISKLQEVLQGLYENGLGRKIDVDRIKVNRVNLETQKAQLLNAIELQKNVLKYSMAMPMSESIVLPDEDIQKLESLVATLKVDPQLDVESLLSVKVLRKQEQLLGLNRDAKRAEFFPTASISGQYMQNTQSNRFNLYTGNALNYSTLNFTLNIHIPIYDGGAKRARVDQAKVDILKNQEEINMTSNALKMAYDNAKIQMQNSIEAIQNQRANLELAKEVYDNINNNFRLGLVNLTDLLNAESELTSTQNAYSDALLQFKVAEIELMKARGEIKNLAIN